ncbi:hypothetical protein SynSYN20_01057 [Synechococcus sp. SYN20]|nr:hypothetical protein SynSYN20_01057 [Synechococcus sp. SYN20]
MWIIAGIWRLDYSSYLDGFTRLFFESLKSKFSRDANTFVLGMFLDQFLLIR